ncbi:hypothetical protein A3D78_04050 [Candidatus Gottesmanbacteria bacterium RIFCSPHIGHO2_02_FULL_39_14]|uniref:Uncharacterized protein n=1 Tax=Candidatus Gottesmanbacteria bacterium RIFCSPHIGHO2_02_FULL_39_14 TaxID=1798383 RepID=A0A1F5ZY27_9BACT|nr:MAG: hypothetical protein A3D78_04050 [Candidatus Gottesmanbacteria bacterium RIFCSPHIGHO2_02_FULL_39_14]
MGEILDCKTVLLILLLVGLYFSYRILKDNFGTLISAIQVLVALGILGLLAIALIAGGFTGEEILILIVGAIIEGGLQLVKPKDKVDKVVIDVQSREK